MLRWRPDGRSGDVMLFSLAGVLVALLAAALTQTAHTLQPPADPPPVCAAPPPLTVSLPQNLPDLAPESTATPAITTGPTAVATPSAAAGNAIAATPVAASTAVTMRLLFRADDLPAAHGLAVTYGPLMPLVIPAPCQVPPEARRAPVAPCAKLLPPGGQLCASGLTGLGRLSNEPPDSAFALQADRVTLQDADGAARLDALQGYFRYDDPDRGLLLVCPQISYIESVSSNALRFIALCSNRGQEGWAVSGQATDGGTAAPDSMSITIDGPNGQQVSLVGSVPVGGLLMRNAPGGG